MSKRILILTAAAISLIACGGGENGEISQAQRDQGYGTVEDFTAVIAKVGEIEITQAYFDFRYELLSPAERGRFTGEDWKNRFLDHLVEETLMYGAARQQKFELLPEVARRLDVARRSILVKAYYDKKFKEEIQPTEEQVAEYYEDHRDSYLKLGMAYGYHIQCSTRERIESAQAEIKSGTRFIIVAGKYSENAATKDKGGELGWFNPGGFVLGVGYSKKFTDLAFSMVNNEVSQPFQLDDDDWHLLKVSSLSQTETQSIDEVRDRIDLGLRPILAKEKYEIELARLRTDLGVKRFGEFQEKEIRTAEQLYRLASESRNPSAKMSYYSSIVELYPEHEYVDDALFMIGFISSEEFGDLTAAAVAFRKIIKEMPNSDKVDQSKWMLRNLGAGAVNLRGRDIPRDPDEATERIERAREQG